MNTIFRPDYLQTFVGFMLVFVIVFFSYSYIYAYVALDVEVVDFLEYTHLLLPVWLIKVIQGVAICGLGAIFTVHCHRCSIDEDGVRGKNTMGAIQLAEWDNIKSVTLIKIPFIPVLRVKLKCGKWSLWITHKALLNKTFGDKVVDLEGEDSKNDEC